MLVFTTLAVAIMGILLTTRHTREDEEEGRIEMIRSLPVGRLSTLTATILVAVLSNIVLSLASGFGLFALGYESMDLNGSLLYGASIFLTSPLGLALRLQRTSIIAWLIGMLVLGASYGSILVDLEGFLSSNDILGQMLPTAEDMSLTERFVSMLMTILSIIGTIPTLMFVLRLNGEEKRNRTENLLAAAVSRSRIIGSYTLIGVVSAPLIQLMSILGLWSAAEVVMDEMIPFLTFLKAGLVHVPAMWILVGIAVLLIGYLPGLAGLTWAYLGYAFFVVYLGDMLKLPDWMSYLSPFGHVPQIPMEEINTARLAVLVLIAVLLVTAGLIGYYKRDIEG